MNMVPSLPQRQSQMTADNDITAQSKKGSWQVQCRQEVRGGPEEVTLKLRSEERIECGGPQGNTSSVFYPEEQPGPRHSVGNVMITYHLNPMKIFFLKE